MQQTISVDHSLNDALRDLGYRTAPAIHGKKAIYTAEGEMVASMTAQECWEFLRERHPEAFDYPAPFYFDE
jgi:hypothetical protein